MSSRTGRVSPNSRAAATVHEVKQPVAAIGLDANTGLHRTSDARTRAVRPAVADLPRVWGGRVQLQQVVMNRS